HPPTRSTLFPYTTLFRSLPNLFEALALPFVVAKNMDRIALLQPAIEPPKKIAPLRLGHLRIRSGRADRSKTLKPLELELSIERLDRKSTRLNSSHVAISY